MSPDLRFPPVVRIRRTSEYREHRRRSRVFRTKTFLVAWAQGLEDAGRIGITASKRAVGSSPKRNRTKRLLREWYRLHRHELQQAWDLVIIAQAGAAEMDLKGVEQELGELITWLNRKTGNSQT